MRKTLLLFFVWCLAHTAWAQLSGAGFYRIQNKQTQRYMSFAGGTYQRVGDTDVETEGLINTKKGFENVVNDPGSVVYVSTVGNSYDFKSQGISFYDNLKNSGYTVTLDIKSSGNEYTLTGTISKSGISVTKTIYDKNATNFSDNTGYLSTRVNSNSSWYFQPVNIGSNNYFGLKPKTIGDEYWATFNADFAFEPGDDKIKVYYVKKVDRSVAIIAPITGTIPAKTPVIVKCSSSNYSDNRLDLLASGGSAPSGNLLRGSVFEGTMNNNNRDYIRVLGMGSDGKPAFVKPSSNRDLGANEAYLFGGGYADEIKILTEEEYEQAGSVTINIKDATRVYGEENPTFDYEVVSGTPVGTVKLQCSANENSPAGQQYSITLASGSLINKEVNVNSGTLTIEKAVLKARPHDVERFAGQPNPTEWEIYYDGFKNNEDKTALLKEPEVHCEANEKTPAGSKERIWLTGGEAQNYTFVFEDGWLTVLESTVTANDCTREYGEPNPEFSYSPSGVLSATPNFSCAATATSPVGDYDINMSAGSNADAAITFVKGKLTVTPATVYVSFAESSYTIKQGDPMPEIKLVYEGFKNGETEAVLLEPVRVGSTEDINTVGRHSLYLTGGRAKNYNIATSGSAVLYVEKADPVTVTAVDKTITYGDPIPEFTFKSEGAKLNGNPAIVCKDAEGKAVSSTTPAGRYQIEITKGDVTNTESSFVNGWLTIEPAPLTITVGNYTKKVGEENPTFTLTYEGFKNGETAETALSQQPTVTTAADTNSPAGQYEVKASGAIAANYTITYVDGTLTIETPESWIEDGGNIYEKNNDGTVSLLTCGEVSGEYEVPATITANGITYPVTAIGSFAFKNMTSLTGIIIPASVEFIGEGAFAGCTNLKFIRLLSRTPITLATLSAVRTQARKAASAVSQFEGVDVDNCVLYVPFGAEEGYRNAYGWSLFKHIVGEHSEADPAVVVTVKNYTREYGEENPAFEFTTEGAALDGEPVVTCEATSKSDAGTYDIIIKKGTVKNYNDTYVKGTLTITKAPLKVTVANCEREEGQENPVFTIQYEGWKNGDTESVLLTKPTATCAADKDSKEGIYPITLGGGEAKNYELSYTDGVLTVKVPAGIETLIANGQPFDVYTTAGVLVRKAATTLKGLPRGIYIVNGKKVALK